MSDDAVNADLPINADDPQQPKPGEVKRAGDRPDSDNGHAYDVQTGHEDRPIVQGDSK